MLGMVQDCAMCTWAFSTEVLHTRYTVGCVNYNVKLGTQRHHLHHGLSMQLYAKQGPLLWHS